MDQYPKADSSFNDQKVPNEFHRIIHWKPHGRAFLVEDPVRFSCYIMPHFFRNNHYTSFQRQLNLYGFKRLSRGADAGSYYHEYFLRNRAYIIDRIQMIKIKGTNVRPSANPGDEPQFYQMPFIEDDPAQRLEGADQRIRVNGHPASKQRYSTELDKTVQRKNQMEIEARSMKNCSPSTSTNKLNPSLLNLRSNNDDSLSETNDKPVINEISRMISDRSCHKETIDQQRIQTSTLSDRAKVNNSPIYTSNSMIRRMPSQNHSLENIHIHEPRLTSISNSRGSAFNNNYKALCPAQLQTELKQINTVNTVPMINNSQISSAVPLPIRYGQLQQRQLVTVANPMYFSDCHAIYGNPHYIQINQQPHLQNIAAVSMQQLPAVRTTAGTVILNNSPPVNSGTHLLAAPNNPVLVSVLPEAEILNNDRSAFMMNRMNNPNPNMFH